MLYVTADHHFGHKNVIKYCNRPFDSVFYMDQSMIGRWNQRVTGADDIYHLGDFTPSGLDVFTRIIEQLHFNKLYIIPGGHDKRWLKDWAPQLSTRIVVLEPIHYLYYKNMKVTLCHYPLHSWSRSCYGSVHLHGHSHGKIGCITGRRADVGVDCWDFYPANIDDVLRRLDEKDQEEM